MKERERQKINKQSIVSCQKTLRANHGCTEKL